MESQTPSNIPVNSSHAIPQATRVLTKREQELGAHLDQFSLEDVVEFKISRFLDQLGGYAPDNLFEIILRQVEKPLFKQTLRRTGGNQVQASKMLGINRNTLRKKMKDYNLN